MEYGNNKTAELLSKYAPLIGDIEPIAYYERDFRKHCKESKPRLSTGYQELDKVLGGGLTNELYILAAETSTGKSALMMAIAQNIAVAGTADVLYFTIEMSRAEFVARGASTISYEHHLADESVDPVMAGDILNWQYTGGEWTKLPYEEYEPYCKEYFHRYGVHLYIVENGLIDGVSARKITLTVSQHKRSLERRGEDRPVVVFVDYLQLLSPDDDSAWTDRKDRIDNAVKDLKTLSVQYDVPVFMASSVQRAGYGTRVSTGSYKESGDTEYTGSVLFGWNWDGVTDESELKAKEREKSDCRKRGYRKMTLEVLKNRNAARDGKVYFDYYPAYQYFVPVERDDDEDAGYNEPIWR